MTEPSSHATHEELMLLYEVTVGDLAYFKSQQWAVANYALLLQAALVGHHQLLDGPSGLERLVLVLLAASIAVAALVVLHKLQRSLRLRHARLEATRRSFSAAFNEAWEAELKGQELVHSVWFLRIAVVVGPVIACWLVLRAPV